MATADPGAHEVVQAGARRSARIESLRAVAALAVLVSHVWLYSHRFAPASYASFWRRALAGGGFGVQLFFALSGFLIFRPFARRDFGDGARIDLRTYARNRAVRILPLYWSAVAILLIFTQAGGSFTQWWRFTTFSESFSTRTAQTVDGPMWSLVVELHFYVLLPLLAWVLGRLCRGRRWPAIACLVMLAVPSVVLSHLDPEPVSVWRFSLPATFYGFVPGMVLALVVIEWQEHRPRWLTGALASANLWLVASAAVWAVTFWRYDLAAPGTAIASFLTVGAVVLPLRHGALVRALDWRPLALVGVASYSLYIWHVPIIEHLYTHATIASFPRLLVVAAPAAIAVAALSYAVIEQPALRLRRRWVRAPGEHPAAAAGERDRLAGWRARLGTDYRWVALIAVVAFLARARTVMATRPLALGGDPFDYDRLGRLLAAGKGFGTSVLSPSGGPTAFRPPAYPLFLGAVYRVTGNSILAARLAQAVLGAVSVVLLWLLARRLFGRRSAYLAAGLFAVYPPVVFATAALMSESLFIPLLLAGLLALAVARDGTENAKWWALAGGAFVGLGMLTRPNSAAMLPALVLFVIAWKRTGWSRRPALARAALVVLGALVVLIPWQVRNTVVMHRFVPISDIDGYNVAGVYNAEAASAPAPARYQFRPPNGVAALAPLFADRTLDEVTLGERLRRAGFDFIADHPTAPLQAEAWNTYRMLELAGVDESAAAAQQQGYGRTAAMAGMVAFWIVAALALAGAATPAVRRTPRSLWLAPLCLWLGTALFLGEPRLRAPIDVFLLLSAAPAIDMVVARARATVAAHPWRAPAVEVPA